MPLLGEGFNHPCFSIFIGHSTHLAASISKVAEGVFPPPMTGRRSAEGEFKPARSATFPYSFVSIIFKLGHYQMMRTFDTEFSRV
jgi:hypothetical protein